MVVVELLLVIEDIVRDVKVNVAEVEVLNVNDVLVYDVNVADDEVEVAVVLVRD